MVIGVVGWGSVRDQRCWDWGGRGASPPGNAVDILLDGEYLCSGTVIRVVYSLSLAINPNI